MMSPAAVHACCGRQAPSLRAWTPSPGRAVPAFSVSGILFGFLLWHNHVCLCLCVSSLACLPLRAEPRGLLWGVTVQHRKRLRQSPLLLSPLLSSEPTACLSCSVIWKKLCYDMICTVCQCYWAHAPACVRICVWLLSFSPQSQVSVPPEVWPCQVLCTKNKSMYGWKTEVKDLRDEETLLLRLFSSLYIHDVGLIYI